MAANGCALVANASGELRVRGDSRSAFGRTGGRWNSRRPDDHSEPSASGLQSLWSGARMGETWREVTGKSGKGPIYPRALGGMATYVLSRILSATWVSLLTVAAAIRQRHRKARRSIWAWASAPNDGAHIGLPRRHARPDCSVSTFARTLTYRALGFRHLEAA